MYNPSYPNATSIREYLDKWKTLENYILQEKSLSLLFNTLCSDNKTLENILLKVSTLNDFYSTNIYDTYTVSKHILELNIDEELKNGNIDLVNKIAPITISGKTRNFYSFASKYCSHHNPETYPIYDFYVVKMLMYFKKQDKFAAFTENDLKNYKNFIEVMQKFTHYYSLNDFSLREIDIYLWLAGKEYFPKNINF